MDLVQTSYIKLLSIFEIMEDNYSLAIIGLENSILLYKAIGVETHPVSSSSEMIEILESLVQSHLADEARTPKYAIIFVEENFYRDLPEDLIKKLAKKTLPAVLPVPSPAPTSKSYSKKRISKIVEKAIGSDILA